MTGGHVLHFKTCLNALGGLLSRCRKFDRGVLSTPPRRQRLYRCALVCAAIAISLSGIMLWSHARGTHIPAGPFGPVARLPIRETLVSGDSFPSGHDTLFPLAFTTPDTFGADSFVAAAFSKGASVRAPASRAIIPRSPPHSPFAVPDKKRGPVAFDRGQISIRTTDGPIPLTGLYRSPLLYAPDADIFQADFFSPPARKSGPPPQLFGEPTDGDGIPVRWSKAAGSGLNICASSKYGNREIVRRLVHGLGVLSAGASHTAQAGKYHAFVKRYAEKYNLASALVLAIMHTESSFNPFAVSPQNAVGLMQVVPDTAGYEVHRFLMGTQGAPSIETLITPEHNIRYGTAYLHLLGRRYFGRVTDPASRQMCMIAAYNGGPGTVMRLFSPDQNEAFDKINALTPSEVYTVLTTEMPHQETRRYVELVLTRIRDYSAQ